MTSNPRQGQRVPHIRVEETVFLTPPEFVLLHDNIQRQRWKDLATWLVSTGMRSSEATALTPADIDANARTCRINKAWKYSGDYRPEIGPPKTKKSIRKISLPQAALDVVDLADPGFLFTKRRRESRSRAGVLQWRLETRSRPRDEGWTYERA